MSHLVAGGASGHSMTGWRQSRGGFALLSARRRQPLFAGGASARPATARRCVCFAHPVIEDPGPGAPCPWEWCCLTVSATRARTDALRSEGRRISAGVDGVRWRPRSSKPLWGCVAVPGGFDPHALPPRRRSPSRVLQELGWPGDASRVRGLATLVRDPSTGRRRPLVAGVGLVARCGVWRWSPAVTARTVDRVRERFPLRESARLRDRAVGDGPAPGCARCRTGRDAQARTSRRPVPRRGVQAGPPQGRPRPLLLEGRMPPRPDVRAAERDETRRHPECPLQRAPIDAQARTSRRRVPRRGVQAGPPQERLRPLLLEGRMPPRPDVRAAERDETRRHPECPLQRAPIDAQARTSRRRVPRRGVQAGQPQERPRLLLLEGRMPPSAQRGECPRMPPRRPSSQAKSNCCDSKRPSARYHS